MLLEFPRIPCCITSHLHVLGIGVWLGIRAQKCLRGQTGNFRCSRRIARHRVYFNVLSKKCGNEFIKQFTNDNQAHLDTNSNLP